MPNQSSLSGTPQSDMGINLRFASAARSRWRIESVRPHELHHDLQDTWRAFASRGWQSPFLLPEWADACNHNDTVRVGVIECENQVRAFLPYELNGRHAVPVGNRYNDLHGLIQSPCSETTGPRCQVAPIELALKRMGVRSMRFRHWIDPSTGMTPHCWESNPFYYIDISQGFEHYSESRRGNKRHKLRREIGRLKRKAEAEFGDVTLDWTMDSAAVDRLLQWKQHQAQAMGWQIDMEAMRTILSRIAPNDETKSPLTARMVTLKFGDQPVASELYFVTGDIMHAWVRSYAADFAKLGPGHLLFWESAQQLADEGVTRIDWGTGEDSFKSKFASGSFPVYGGWADRSRLRSHLRRHAVNVVRRFNLADWVRPLVSKG